MCGPKFCSMKITQEIKGLKDNNIIKINNLKAEMDKKSHEFKEQGSEIYLQQ
jgi:phosphomethylpyrimidine synthase